MSYEFSNIILTKDELRILNKLNKQNSYIEDEKTCSILTYHGLIEQIYDNVDGNHNLIFGGTCKISEYGERYLVYLKRIRSKTIWEWIRYAVTTLIAILALGISLSRT